MRVNGQRARKSAEKELHALVASSEELLKSLGEQSGDAVAALKLKLSRNIAQAKSQMSGLAEALEHVSSQAEEEARQQVTRRPWLALGFGVVLGVALATAAVGGAVAYRRR